MGSDTLLRAIRGDRAADAFRPALAEDDWAQVVAVMQRRELAAGELLVERGRSERVAHLLESGELQVFVTGGPAASHRIAVLRPGAIVGEPGLFGEALRMAHVEALGPAVVWTLSGPALEALAARHPRTALELLRAAGQVMAARMRANLERGIPVT